LEKDENPQLDLFNEGYNRGKALEPLMQATEAVNERYGRGTVKLGCGIRKMRNEELGMGNGGSSEPWGLRRDYLSPSYTTNIEEIPLVY